MTRVNSFRVARVKRHDSGSIVNLRHLKGTILKTLRKHAYSNILKILPPKKMKFFREKF